MIKEFSCSGGYRCKEKSAGEHFHQQGSKRVKNRRVLRIFTVDIFAGKFRYSGFINIFQVDFRLKYGPRAKKV